MIYFPVGLFIGFLLFITYFIFLDDEENLVDEGAEDFKPSEPQSKAEARGVYNHFV